MLGAKDSVNEILKKIKNINVKGAVALIAAIFAFSGSVTPSIKISIPPFIYVNYEPSFQVFLSCLYLLALLIVAIVIEEVFKDYFRRRTRAS